MIKEIEEITDYESEYRNETMDVIKALKAKRVRSNNELIKNKVLLRIEEVAELTTLSRVTIWRREKAGTFPRHLNLGAEKRGDRNNRKAWFKDDVLEWLESCRD